MELRQAIDALPVDVAVCVGHWCCSGTHHIQVTANPDLMFADPLLELLTKSGADWHVADKNKNWTSILISTN